MTSRAPWIEVLAAAAIGVVELAGAIGMHVWFEALPDDERPIPLLAALPWLLLAFAVFAFGFGFLRVARRRDELVETRARVGTYALLGAHLVLTLVGGIGVVVSDPDFLFGQTRDDSIDLPDGGHAYLYRGGLFCSYEVYVATADDLFSFRAQYISRNACEEPATLRLDGNQIVVVDANGQPLSDNGADWAAVFDWRPH